MRKLTLALATTLVLLSSVSSALASGRDVINDCTDDEVMSRTYTQKEYREALAQLPADADQYGDCRDIIARAQEAAAIKGGASTKKNAATTGTPTSGGPGATPPSSQPATQQLATATPADRAAALDAAKHETSASVAAGDPVSAADVATAPGDSSSDLPTPVLVLLALLFAGALALAAVRVRSLVNTRRA